MNEDELSCDAFDLKKIKKKWLKSTLFLSLAAIIVGGIIYYSYGSNISFVSILLYIIFLVIIYELISKGVLTLKDLTTKIKIKTKLTVKEKKIQRNFSTSDSGGGSNTHELIFEKNKLMRTYDVKFKIFKQVKKGEQVHVEYSKFGKWILKIENDTTNIENKSVIM